MLSKEEILDRAYLSKMHWQTVNRKRVLEAMDVYAAVWKQKAQGLVAVTEALLDQYKMACRDFCRKNNLEFIESDYPSIVNATKSLEQFKQ